MDMDISQLLLHKPAGSPVPMPPQIEAPAAVADDPAQHAEQLRSVSKQFEAVFLHQIVKQMQETIDYASFDEEDGSGEHIQSMYWSSMADTVAQQGGMGFWKIIYDDLARSQGIDIAQHPAERRLDVQA